jgi:hypothetical protein
MCTQPLLINGYEVSCRECDQCVATYKNAWVGRCVAEKQVMPHAYAITLTYADVDGKPPLGARVFNYEDVKKMWKRIRSAGKRKWKENIELRYVIVGEKGTRNGRCHYHGVVFSNYPIHDLGQITHPMGNAFAYKRRLNWSIWGHGFVEFQVADRDGMSYCLKYILKGKMTGQRATGHGREGKTEWLASSYMWCSKKPPVGSIWLWRKLREMVDNGMSPASLRIRVPGGGDWYVSGPLQKQVCLFLKEANERYRSERGRDLAGWKPLIASVDREIELRHTGEIVKPKAWEWLVNGEEEDPQVEPENTEEWSAERWREYFEESDEHVASERYRLDRNKQAQRAYHVVEKCLRPLPCASCLAKRSDAEGQRFESEAQRNREEYQNRFVGDFEKWWAAKGRIHEGCLAARDDWRQRAAQEYREIARFKKL